MRFVSYTAGNAPGFGMLTADGQGVIELGSAGSQRIKGISDLGQLVGHMRIEEAREFADEPADHAVTDITYERLLPWPQKIFCIGVNYGGRSAEYEDKSDAAWPSVFVRFPDSFTGHERDVIRPPESPQLDYEGEIVVISQDCHWAMRARFVIGSVTPSST